ncbi:TPA: hypothetical protein KOU56_003964 [Clostridioides difficile]|nr:hypothetical protein [Clostridioides difficile]
MGDTRVLHCGDIIDNYYLCINESIAGFTKRGQNKGDIIYFAVRIDKTSYCGARGLLGDITDYRPNWEDVEKYKNCFRVEKMEYCKPFNLNILKECHDRWGLKFLIGSKAFNDKKAINLLNKKFKANKTKKICDIYEYIDSKINNNSEDDVDEKTIVDTEEEIKIMGTFQTINFKSETDIQRGLEPLVTKHFYQLFPFTEENSVLISENRAFSTSGVKNDNSENIKGIKSIPDALLISYDKSSKKAPLKLNLIEYECYGEGKVRASEKFTYLNGQVIPQLMRFASAFSIITDNKLRDKTIKSWIEKIMTYVESNEQVNEKIIRWMKELNPNIKQMAIYRDFESELRKSFKMNINIILIIDEMTSEQKETIKNIIRSFKLDNTSSKENYIDFSSYIVRLEQKIDIYNKDGDYALSFQ